MYTSIWWYLRVLPVLHRPEVVDNGVNTIRKNFPFCLKDYRIRSFLSIQYVHGDLCKHLGIDSSTDLDVMDKFKSKNGASVSEELALFN